MALSQAARRSGSLGILGNQLKTIGIDRSNNIDCTKYRYDMKNDQAAEVANGS
jgi:hypothetical protein